MKIGFNKKDVTPNGAVNMAGYERNCKSIGVLDSIEINTLIINYNGKPVVISILDSIMLEESFCQQVRNTIASEYNIQKSNILIGCIHTHSAPAYFKLAFEDTKVEEQLQLEVRREMLESIRESLENQVECSVTFKSCEIEGLYGNRNEKEGWSDKSVNILEFKNNNKIIYSLLNISVHPTLLNGENLLLSSDLLGWIRQKYSKLTNAPTLVCNGTTGDVSTRFYRKASGKDELLYVSDEIITQLRDKLTTKDINLIYRGSNEIEYISQSDFSKDDTTLSVLEGRITCPFGDMYKRRSELKLNMGIFNLKLLSCIINFGDVLIISLPGDVVSEFGRRIKQAFKNYNVILICYTNSYCNYIVNKEQYGRYFETFNSRLNKGEGDIFINKVINGVKDLL